MSIIYLYDEFIRIPPWVVDHESFRRWKVVKFRDGDLDLALGMDDLLGFAVADVERRPEDLVPLDDFIKAVFESPLIQLTAEPIPDRHAISRVAGCHLIHQPHLELRKGKRTRFLVRPFGDDRWSAVPD